MCMSENIESEKIDFVVTKAGLNAQLDANEKNIKLSLSKVVLGAGQYIPTADRTVLAAPFTENGISAGGIEVNSFTLRMMLIMNYQFEKPVSEIGLYTSTGILFAVASKPDGSFFRLYPGIDYVANFGLVLNAVGTQNIEIVLDGRGGVATQLMQQHTLQEDPHPQYKVYAGQLITQHINEADPHSQYALKSFLKDETKKLDNQIGLLLGLSEYLFPPLLQAGYASTETVTAERRKGANYSWASRSIVYHFCPEAKHEGWSTVRESSKFTTKVTNRSGTNTIAYSGHSDYVIIDTERTLLKRGFLSKTNQLANEIKSGVFEAGEKLTILREAWETLAYNTNDVVLLLTPEGSHEAWEVTRTADSFNINVWARSGTNRVGYSGRVNWSLFKANNESLQRDKYPFNLITGVTSGSSFVIPAPEGHDFTDPTYLPIITPEGSHEAWTITRQKGGFKVDVFGRSGTNTIGYSGRVNWAVFITTKPVQRSVFYKGTHKIEVQAGKTVTFAMYGAGGGGGGSIYTPVYTPANATHAENTILTLGTTKFTAGGGKGGTGGAWGNGSHYFNGEPGAGGENLIENLTAGFTVLKNVDGNDAVITTRWERQIGGIATSFDSGLDVTNAGGAGAWGIGDERWSYGGSGGSGGYLLVEFTNYGRDLVVFDLVVGDSGKGWIVNGLHGDDGGPSFVILSREV